MHQLSPTAVAAVFGGHNLRPFSDKAENQENVGISSYAVHLNFDKLPQTNKDKLDSAATPLLDYGTFLQQYLALQQQGALFNPFSLLNLLDVQKLQQDGLKSGILRKDNEQNGSCATELSEASKLSVDKKERTFEPSTPKRLNSLNKRLKAKSPPKKEQRVKGSIYVVQNERKKWDGRQWRRLCVAENCECAARGATKYCVNHGKQLFNVNVKNYKRSNIPKHFEGLIKEPREKKIKLDVANKGARGIEKSSTKSSCEEKGPILHNMMHILAQAASTV